MSVPASQERWVHARGRYAGSVSRGAAYVIDLIISIVVFELILTAVAFVAQVVTGRGFSWHHDSITVAAIFVLWQFAYFGYHWANHRKTPGMSVLGLHVVEADGRQLRAWRGWVRSLTFPLGFLTLGLGFLAILVQREHRALHDLVAGTAVVYAGDARAARLRSPAHDANPVPALARARARR